MMTSVIDSTVIFLLEPFHGVILRDFMLGSDSAFASSAETDSASWSFKNDVEVHTENTSERVILDTQIDMFLNTETKTSTVREVFLFQLSVFDLETSFKDLISFLSSDSNMHSNFFVSLNTETSNGVFSSRRD